jgi:hypothetical protein
MQARQGVSSTCVETGIIAGVAAGSRPEKSKMRQISRGKTEIVA